MPRAGESRVASTRACLLLEVPRCSLQQLTCHNAQWHFLLSSGVCKAQADHAGVPGWLCGAHEGAATQGALRQHCRNSSLWQLCGEWHALHLADPGLAPSCTRPSTRRPSKRPTSTASPWPAVGCLLLCLGAEWRAGPRHWPAALPRGPQPLTSPQSGMHCRGQCCQLHQSGRGSAGAGGGVAHMRSTLATSRTQAAGATCEASHNARVAVQTQLCIPYRQRSGGLSKAVLVCNLVLIA